MTDTIPNVPRPTQGEEHDEQPSRRGPLIALAVVVVLLLGGIWLSRTLHGVSSLQDCVMSGRSNCAPIGK